jgi:hypothetical protein
MLDSSKPLFLSGCDDLAILDHACRSIAVKRIQTQDQ